jgi:hypothetical protein
MVAACKKSCRPNLQAHVAPIELLPAVATGSSCSGACTRHHAGIVVCLSVRPNIVSRFLAKIMGVLPHVPLVRKSPGAMRAGLILFASGTIIWCEIGSAQELVRGNGHPRRPPPAPPRRRGHRRGGLPRPPGVPLRHRLLARRDVRPRYGTASFLAGHPANRLNRCGFD